MDNTWENRPRILHGGVGYVTKSPPDTVLEESIELKTLYESREIKAHGQVMRR
jgi:hypothetical protein